MADNYWVPMRLPSPKEIAKYALWGTGRVILSGWLFGLFGVAVVCKAIINVTEMTKQTTLQLLKVYDQLPYMGAAVQNIIDVSVTTVTEQFDIITDIVAATEGKQVMVIGEMGTGKSTIAQYLAYTVGGRVKVYECEGTPTDWLGLEVIGKGENWAAIERGMLEDLEDLSNQMKTRNERGDGALEGTERVIIVEEYPELVSKVPSSGEWLERHARRGRKARRFTVLLSQYDRVAAWGLEGKSDLADAFYRIRLGKKAQSHAKSLKNNALVDWLKQDRSHCLLDDSPCKLPNYREMKSASTRYGSTMLPPNSDNAIQHKNEAENALKSAYGADFGVNCSSNEELLWRIIQRFGAEKSDSAIVTEILGFTGKRYSEGKSLLEKLRREFG
jgi:energy-coupling factor transporter ATP-binding protein EcfA2